MNDNDFTWLLNLPLTELLRELTIAHSELAQLHVRIGFLRAEEIRNKGSLFEKAERVESEGSRDALIEKKFLLVRLIEGIGRDAAT